MQISKYVGDHWRGNHSLARAFFVNGILFYLFLIAAGVLFSQITNNNQTVMMVFIVTLAIFGIWSFIGIGRTAWKIVWVTEYNYTKRWLALAAFFLSAFGLIALFKDVRMLLF